MQKFEKLLLIHCHTTGINWNGLDITLNKQPLSIALGVVDSETLKLVDKVYLRIAFDGEKYKWDDKLSSIHGITKEDREDGETFENASAILLEFLDGHFDLSGSIPVMGYNPLSFHVPFLRKMLDTVDIELNFDSRDIDLFPIMAMLGKFTIKEAMSVFDIDTDEPMTSLETIRTYLKIYKTIRHILVEEIG